MNSNRLPPVMPGSVSSHSYVYKSASLVRGLSGDTVEDSGVATFLKDSAITANDVYVFQLV